MAVGVKIVVLGGGPGGYVAAVRAAQAGAEVTLIEQDEVGGTCLNRGCIPSKVLMTSAELFEKFRKASEFGLNVEGRFLPDMARLMQRKHKVVQDQVAGILRLLKHHKIRLIRGVGRIASPDQIQVKTQGGEVEHVPWDRLILALGSEAMPIPSLPFDGQRIISSNEALSLAEIPDSILIVGAGVIGCEFAFILSALGSRVTLVEAMDRLLPLPSVDEDCSKILQREMKKRKIGIMTNRTLIGVDENKGKLRATIGPSPFADGLSDKLKEPLSLDVDKVLVCIGRSPNTADVGLERIGVKSDEKGWIVANERMETNVPRVYAIGDVLGPAKIMLAHVASREAFVAVSNSMGKACVMDYKAVPGAIFTMPEVANVGLTESQARGAGYNVRSDTVLFRNIGKSQVIGQIAGQAKIVSDLDTGKVLSVHIIGPHATELIGEATLAVNTGCTTQQLADTIHPHPTLSEILLETSLKSIDMALHG